MKEINNTEQNKTEQRFSNFEFLRILAMLMIVASHAVKHGGTAPVPTVSTFFTSGYITNVLFASWGQLGVCIFIVISSYFLCDANGIHFKKVIMIYAQTLLYSLIICFTFKIFNIEHFGPKQIIKAFLTPIYQWTEYWFIRQYLNFYLLVPILQKLIKSIPDIALGKIILVLSIVVPGFMMFFLQENVKEIGEFTYLFLFTAYLKRKKNNVIERKPELFVIIIFTTCILFIFLFDWLTFRFGIRNLSSRITMRYFPAYIFAISLFFFAKKYWKFKNRIINFIAKTTLGIYIIHENPLMYFNKNEPFLFCRLFKIGKHSILNTYPIYLLSVVILVFFICSVIEAIRILLIDNTVFKKGLWIDKVCKKIDNWYSL
ncbi:acyltransferase [Treponema rectale]|uniref:Acyltransferase n=1 Tax=Treponema rectale TaxID=744512 RepID=A0A840SFU3_9SPIR|nr:acyltransferase [Treponema rectale]MBB5218413.1 peptidoglycan/LPS O-acetylase OafA/YrhL [Treponema rectale]QOS39895.1 acyltransferase [Treponema rectale]